MLVSHTNVLRLQKTLNTLNSILSQNCYVPQTQFFVFQDSGLAALPSSAVLRLARSMVLFYMYLHGRTKSKPHLFPYKTCYIM